MDREDNHDFIDAYNLDEYKTAFYNRFRITEIEYKAALAHREIDRFAVKDSLENLYNILIDIGDKEADKIKQLITECDKDRQFSISGLNRDEFEKELRIYFGIYKGTEKYLCDYINGTSGNYNIESKYAFDELYKYYTEHGCNGIQELLAKCREEDILIIDRYSRNSKDIHNDKSDIQCKTGEIQPPEIPLF